MKTFIFLISILVLGKESQAQQPLILPAGEESVFDPMKSEKTEISIREQIMSEGGEDTAFDPLKNASLINAIDAIMLPGGEDTAFDPLKTHPSTNAINELIQEGGETIAFDPMKKEENENKRPLTESGGEEIVFDPLKDENEMNTLSRKTKITEEDITVYPNPATDLLVVQSNGTHPDGIELYDMSGRMVLQIDGSAATNDAYQLNVGHLERGWYTLVLRYDPIVIAKKTVLF